MLTQMKRYYDDILLVNPVMYLDSENWLKGSISPENSSFKATFTEMKITECKWLAHDGQQPDLE